MKKSVKWILIVAAVLVLAAMVAFVLPGIGGEMKILGMVRDLLQREELALQLAMELDSGGEVLKLDADVERIPVRESSVIAVRRSGGNLYFSGDAMVLENGTVYTLRSGASEDANLSEVLLEMLTGAEILESEGVYTISEEGDRARNILRALPGNLAEKIQKLTLELVTRDDAITRIRVELQGEIRLWGELTVTEEQPAALPQPVRDRIENGDLSGTDISEHLPQLTEALMTAGGWDAVAAEGTLTTELGFLPLSYDVRFHYWRMEGSSILAMDTGLLKRYYSQTAVCDEQGRLVAEREEKLDVQQVLELAWQLVARGQITFGRSDQSYTCVLSPDPDVMALMAHTVLPDTAGMDISFQTGSIGLQVLDGEWMTLYVRIPGTMRVLLFDTDVALELMLHPKQTDSQPPQAVVDALCPE